MKKHGWRSSCWALALSALLVQAPNVMAADASPRVPAASENSWGFDWIRHTQRTLDELQGKLSLAGDQTGGWETWSRGVMQDARHQLASKASRREHQGRPARPEAEETTPERMSRGIEQLRTEIGWMQERLAQLEGAQARTKAFYDTLDPKQKVIFDMYWHEVQHRASGRDDMSEMHGHEAAAPGAPWQRHDAPAGAD